MITRIRIDNFRCLVGFDFKPDRFNLLLGRNGSGKSSVFDALHALVRHVGGLAGVEELFPAWWKNRWLPPEHRQSFRIDATIGGASYQYDLIIDHDRRGRAFVLHEAVRRDRTTLLEYDGDVVRMLGARDGEPSSYPFEGRQSPLAVLSTAAVPQLAQFTDWMLRLWVIRPVPQLMVADSRGDASWLDPDLSNFSGWFRDLMQEEPKTVDRIARSLRPVLDGFQGFSLPRESLHSRTLRLRFKEKKPAPDAPPGFALDELSEGQRMLVALYALMHAVVGTGRTLLVDEPDNYVALPEIQPWLDAMRDLAEERDGQVFLISHHPRVIDLLAASAGFWFERRGQGPVKVRRISDDEAEGSIAISQLLERGWLHG